MNKLVRSASAVVLAAMIAGILTILPSFSEPVDASAPIKVAIAAAPVPVVTGSAVVIGWPAHQVKLAAAATDTITPVTKSFFISAMLDKGFCAVPGANFSTTL